jgi:PleD family two-component response regulator
MVESKPLAVDDDMIELTVSIGMATEHGRPSDWRDLLGAAEAALLRARQAGRNRIELADPGPAARLLSD